MVAFTHLVVRSARRIRLEFSSQLAAGAFATSWYSFVCEDSSTGDPLPVAALAVKGEPYFVEIALDRDLAPGGQYTLHLAAGVPALDASTAASAVQYFYPPSGPQAPSENVSARDLLLYVFQEDLAHDPSEGHQLAPDGDIATLTGPPSVKANGTRGLVSSGLPHRNKYGANLRQYVDAPSEMLPTLRGAIERQLRRDDRVIGAKGSMQEGKDGEHFVVGELDLIGQVKTNLKEPIRARR